MTREALRERELLLIDILQTGLDLRTMAAEAGSPILAYLAEVLARRAREELDATATPLDATSADATPCNGQTGARMA